MTSRFLILLAAAVGAGAADFTYWIQPCSDPETACQPADPQLAMWALGAWQTASEGRLRLIQQSEPRHARIRIYWAGGHSGLYGEARAVDVDGQRGAEVFVLPDMTQLGPAIASATRRDPLLREAIVYLTCLHESGHALGLVHTADFDDIMYSFGYGGDIVAYFERYRRQLHSRDDLRTHSGLSPADKVQLLRMLLGHRAAEPAPH